MIRQLHAATFYAILTGKQLLAMKCYPALFLRYNIPHTLNSLTMNMLFGDGQPSRLEQAKLEVKMMNDMFTRMNATCFKKCAIKFHENDLNVGEMTCIDR
jgi:hypothetical protein